MPRRVKKRGNGEGSVYKRESDGRWTGAVMVGYTSEGKPRKKQVYGKTRAEAVAKMDQVKRELADGKPVFIERQTVARFLKRWLDTSEPSISPKSFRTYSDIVRMHLTPVLGQIELSKLTPDHVQDFVNNKSKDGLSPTTVKHCRDCLRAALNLAMRWSLIERNAAALVKLPKRVRRKPQALNREQALRFVGTIRGHRLEALFLVALCLGMREGEVLGLRKEDVDLERRTIRIRYSLQRINGTLKLMPTKTEESQRDAQLPDVVVSALASHFARQEDERSIAGPDWVDSAMVFTTTKGTMLDARNMLREYYKLRALAVLPSVRFHDLRHSAATLLHAAGVPMAMIQKLLGHASMRTTQEVYSHVTSDMETQAAETMDDLFKTSCPATLTTAKSH